MGRERGKDSSDHEGNAAEGYKPSKGRIESEGRKGKVQKRKTT